MLQFIEELNGIVWGIPSLVLILGVGVYFSIRTGFAQIGMFRKAAVYFARKLRPARAEGDVSPFQALCTALAATVGTGNIAGVAGAIAIGGPGAVFWMWISAILGMIVKCAEAALAVRFRQKGSDGEYYGGPMQMIRSGMHSRWRFLAAVYAFMGIFAAFGVGNATQVNAVISGIDGVMRYFGSGGSNAGTLVISLLLALLVLMVLCGGAKRIGKLSQYLVPVSAVAYILFCIGVLIVCADRLPGAFRSVFTGAFSPQAVTGGMVGSAFTALRVGVSRGVFTNEAGMGTASMAHASATVSHPVEQGFMGIMEVFLDTLLICTMTALVILCSGVDIHYGVDEGAALTTRAFSRIYGSWVHIPVACFMACFAFATMIGWGLYGIRCAQYLFGESAWKIFAMVQFVVTVFCSQLQTATVWMLAETVNGLMAVPNLIALIALSSVFITLIKDYKRGGLSAIGGTYESFYQCKPLRTVTYAEVPSAGCGSQEARHQDPPFEHWSAGY